MGISSSVYVTQFTIVMRLPKPCAPSVSRRNSAMARMRADALFVSRGFAATRAQAQAAIAAGTARADGAVVSKPSQMIDESAHLVFEAAHPWASRAGLKLAHALDAFAINPKDLICLDIGASTGGFTDVLLTHGARRVYAVDVGHGQMLARLRNDPRVITLERLDARALTPAQAPEPVDLIVCDASFIGLEKILPAPLRLAAARAVLLALIKPQFESGPRRGELLTEEMARTLAEETAARLDGLEGFAQFGFADSPIAGGSGAIEFLYAARRG
jgi:23S rRNA (cytidine1920-2'-O)/16S rRNA (cytidine1409-2'-O)-methyltransferase